MKRYLIDEDLFSENVKDFENLDLDYKRLPDAVGIKSEITNSKRKYIVYVTSERGNIKLTKDFDDFGEALKEARKLYEALILYYQAIIFDIAKINKRKYFTEETISEIYRKLREIGIDELPVLGTAIEFGLGFICLEEDDGIFKFYIIDRASKFEVQKFDNIEDAINKLVLCYKNFELVDDADKMKEVFYQVLDLNTSEQCQDTAWKKLIKRKS